MSITGRTYGADHLDQLASDLEELADLDTGLPEIIIRRDLVEHEWLRRILLAADSINNRIGRRDLSWLKENAS